MAINYARIVDPIIQSIENGVVPWRKEWSPSTALPQNHVHKKPYTGTNILSCWVHSMKHGFTSNRYMTMAQIMEAGLQLKWEKGDERRQAVPILFTKKSIKKVNGEDEERFTMRIYNCFNIEQVEGVTDPAKVKLHDHHPADIGLAIKLTKALNIEIEGGEPAYVPHRDVIKMPDASRFSSVDAFCTTLAHECVHSTGHPTRLDRDMSCEFGSDDYAKEELIAELGAAFIAAEWGISSQLENHASYLDNWLKVLKETPQALITASSQAQKAHQYIREQLAIWDIHQDNGLSLQDLIAYDSYEERADVA
jgi:antirestriction protein ArdC